MSDAMQLIEDCEARESRLSDWDAQFIDSLRHQIEAGRSLSEKQDSKLNEIWERATAKG